MILTITTADAPVFPGAAAKPGALVILGGANRAHAREADDALMARARVFADHLDGCVERAGDLKIPLGSGALKRERIAGEIGASGRPRRRRVRAPTSPCSSRSG